MTTELTPTERRIAANVARGLTNQQIADTLGMASQTVKNHLSTIFHKLQVANRTQLAIKVLAEQPSEAAAQ